MKSREPFERLHIDITGPHPRSRRGNVYILTVSDAFSRWVEAFPLPNHEASTIARVLTEQVFCWFGTPITLLSDRGRDVDGVLMWRVCEILGVDKLRTTAYKPSTNAAIERFHRTLNAMLAKAVASYHRNWDTALPYVTFWQHIEALDMKLQAILRIC